MIVYTLWRLWRNNWGWDWGRGHLLLGLTTPWGSNLFGSRWRRGRIRGRLVFLFIRIINNTPSASTHRQRGHNFYHLEKMISRKKYWMLNNFSIFTYLKPILRAVRWKSHTVSFVPKKINFFQMSTISILCWILFLNPCKCCWYVLTCIFNFFNVLAVFWMQIIRFLLLYLPIGNYTKVLAKNVLWWCSNSCNDLLETLRIIKIHM